jgi:hypothetical protein
MGEGLIEEVGSPILLLVSNIIGPGHSLVFRVMIGFRALRMRKKYKYRGSPPFA